MVLSVSRDVAIVLLGLFTDIRAIGFKEVRWKIKRMERLYTRKRRTDYVGKL